MQAERARDLGEFLGQPSRVEAPRVAHHADAALHALAEDALHLPGEDRGVSLAALAPFAMENRHRDLRQVVAGDHVDAPAADHFFGSGEAVSEKSGDVANDELFSHARGAAGPI
jgi:hypothetical protein